MKSRTVKAICESGFQCNLAVEFERFMLTEDLAISCPNHSHFCWRIHPPLDKYRGIFVLVRLPKLRTRWFCVVGLYSSNGSAMLGSPFKRVKRFYVVRSQNVLTTDSLL